MLLGKWWQAGKAVWGSKSLWNLLVNGWIPPPTMVIGSIPQQGTCNAFELVSSSRIPRPLFRSFFEHNLVVLWDSIPKSWVMHGDRSNPSPEKWGHLTRLNRSTFPQTWRKWWRVENPGHAIRNTPGSPLSPQEWNARLVVFGEACYSCSLQ